MVTTPELCWFSKTLENNNCILVQHFLLCLWYAVYYRKCTNECCGTDLHFDGQEKCIINMKTCCIAYEVMRRYMFSFFHGRYASYCTVTGAHLFS